MRHDPTRTAGHMVMSDDERGNRGGCRCCDDMRGNRTSKRGRRSAKRTDRQAFKAYALDVMAGAA